MLKDDVDVLVKAHILRRKDSAFRKWFKAVDVGTTYGFEYYARASLFDNRAIEVRYMDTKEVLAFLLNCYDDGHYLIKCDNAYIHENINQLDVYRKNAALRITIPSWKKVLVNITLIPRIDVKNKSFLGRLIERA